MTKPLIVITGASSGIGLALAFAGEGNPLLLISRHIEPVPELAEHAVIYARVDVADYPAMEQAIRSIAPRSSLAPPSALVNDTGTAGARDFKSIEAASCSHEIDVNLKGVLNCTKVVIGDISRRHSGTIINISSVSDSRASSCHRPLGRPRGRRRWHPSPGGRAACPWARWPDRL